MCKGFEAGSMIKELKEASAMRMWQAGGKVKGAETSHQESWLLFEARWPAIERFSGER